ncbi:Odorant receptor 56a [Trichinella pseudospiralis]
MDAKWSVEEEREQSPFQPILYENSDKTIHHLCIQDNFRHAYNFCMEYVTEAIKREEETFNINVLQLVFGIICIISNGILLHLFALRSSEKKAYSLQQGFYFGCMLNGFAYVGYLGRRFAVGRGVFFIRLLHCRHKKKKNVLHCAVTFIALCDIFAIALYVASSIAILLSRSTYSCVRKIQIKRQIVVMKQIVLMVLFAVFCQLIPYTFVLITQFFDLNKKNQLQIYMWTIQPIGLSIAPLCRLFSDSKLLSAMKIDNPSPSSVLKSKMKSSSSNHVVLLNLKCKITPK